MSTITDQVRDHLRRTAEGVTAAAIAVEAMGKRA